MQAAVGLIHFVQTTATLVWVSLSSSHWPRTSPALLIDFGLQLHAPAGDSSATTSPVFVHMYARQPGSSSAALTHSPTTCPPSLTAIALQSWLSDGLSSTTAPRSCVHTNG